MQNTHLHALHIAHSKHSKFSTQRIIQTWTFHAGTELGHALTQIRSSHRPSRTIANPAMTSIWTRLLTQKGFTQISPTLQSNHDFHTSQDTEPTTYTTSQVHNDR